ncbi:MAG: hypothetical protein K0R52_441 [Alphaproteobacteria bacterium]|jgi:hypothetical protein|nr:hypothetical protein [Alphaproteobacteria bacterium]
MNITYIFKTSYKQEMVQSIGLQNGKRPKRALSYIIASKLSVNASLLSC